jgi:glycosyltransferase involved in cell wall biosynthesis
MSVCKAVKKKNQSDMPLVSVIMNCLNGEKYLKDSIDSVYGQTYTNWEIIFWDNASTDRSAEIAKSYDSRLRYFRGNKTISLGAARNEALKQARGAFIAFLDCDDLWMQEKLEKQIPLFDDHEVGLVYSDVMNFNEMGDECRVYRRLAYYRGYCFDKLLKCYFFSMPSVVIRAEALKREREWFDQQFELIAELDLFTRIAYSWKIDMCCDVLARYRLHAASDTWRKEELGFREREVLCDKYCNLWSEFASTYASMMEMQTNYIRAIFLWKVNRANEGRRCLLPNMLKNMRSLLLYFASYFSYKLVFGMYDKYTKTVRPL